MYAYVYVYVYARVFLVLLFFALAFTTLSRAKYNSPASNQLLPVYYVDGMQEICKLKLSLRTPLSGYRTV